MISDNRYYRDNRIAHVTKLFKKKGDKLMTIQVQESPDSMAIDVRVESPAGILADFSKNAIIVELQSNTTIDIIVQKENTEEFEHVDVINCDFISLNADDFGKSIIIYDVVNFQM